MRTLVSALVALAAPSLAHAACVYDGVPSDYVRCLADELATAQADILDNFDDITNLLDRVSRIEEGGALVWPSDPVVHMRYQTDMCRLQHSGYGGTIHYPSPFDEPAVVVATVDESLENSGATWSWNRRWATNQFSFVCDLTSDGYMWFAMEPGVHEIDGKMVQAGRLDSASTHDTVFFPALFEEPPIIFTLPAGSNAYSRVIGTPATGGFDVWVDTATRPLNWIAMERGV